MSDLWQRTRSLLTAHWLLLTLFAIPLIAPLLRWWQVACTHDDHLHRFRVVALRHAWENGLFFSRWIPDLAFGYGFPFLIYREPLPLYLILIPHWLGLPLTAATNLFYLVCIVLGAGFMFLWVRDVLGDAAAFVSALVYLTTPYILVNAYIRGNLVESFALALLPLLCWAGQRYVLLAVGRWPLAVSKPPAARSYFLLTTLTLAILSLSHNISLLIFTPLFLVYLLVVGWLHRLDWRRTLVRTGLVLGLGLGVTLFHTATAVLEIGQVSLNQSVNNRNNDFHYNFTSVEELLAPVAPQDPSLLNPPLPFRLGWVPAGLALLGLGLVFWQKDRVKRGHIVLMGLFAAACLFMSLPISVTIWESLPLIDFIQFPWRFVGRAALPIAFLAGVPFSSLAVGRWPLAVSKTPAASSQQPAAPTTQYAPRILFFLALAALVLETLPNLYPNHCTEIPYPTINDLHEYEHATGLVGVDPTGSYFPVTVRERPTGSRLEADYQAGQTPQRWELPPDVLVHEVEYGNNRGRVHLTAPVPFTARYLTFAFPGWQATLDGEPISIAPGDPEGLITFPVPAGEHTLTVHWGWTTQRAVLAGLSLLAGLGIGFVAISRWPLASSVNPGQAVSQLPAASRQRPLLHPTLCLALALIAFKFLVVDRIDTPFRRAAAPQVQHSVHLTVADLELVGYDLSHDTIPSGGSFAVDLAWLTHQSPGINLQSSLLLVGPNGLIWSEKELFRTRLYENAPGTFFWLPGQWAWDSWDVTVLPGTPPGQYDLVLTMFELDTLRPRTLVNISGEALGATAVIGQVHVTTPDEPVTVRPQYTTQTTIAGLNLLGYNLDRAEARPGDSMLVTLFWEKARDSEQLAMSSEQSPVSSLQSPSHLTITILNEMGQIAQSWDIPPVREDYPPEQWQPGERLRGQLPIRFAAALDSGIYTLQLEDFPLGQIHLAAPEHILVEPTYESSLDVSFGETITLLGYTQAPVTSLQLPLTLIWQTNTELTSNYHVFVHLVNENGAIVTQSDGEPANWERPTTGWMAGEYIIDNHPLTLPAELPPGLYTLRIGLYDPDTGERLPTPDGDAVNIPITLP